MEGIEFRSVTVIAYRGKEGPCWDRKQAVVYKGPFRIYSRPPYAEHFHPVEPRVPVPLEEARPFPCGADMRVRDPGETKGGDHKITTEAPSCSGGDCC